ncbi:exonuclease SbcCD subunit D [bacterium]|nr:exonuclease SbcCD subunit D [bacterium]
MANEPPFLKKMRILHTGDWHIGISRWGIDRTEEVFKSIEFIVDIVEKEDVDVVLIAGDLFEHKMPKGDDLRRTAEILQRLGEKDRKVIIVSGNHDWKELEVSLGIFSSSSNVHFLTELGVKPFRTRKGELLYVGSFPYFWERDFLYIGDDSDRKEKLGEIIHRYLEKINQRFLPNSVNVLLGHIFVEGALLGSAVRLSFSSNFAIPPSWFPNRAHYVALGHAHKPQSISNSPVPTYYCGSIIRIDFSETGDKKCVNVIDAKPERIANVEKIEIPCKELIELDFKFSQLESKAVMVKDFDGYIKAKIHMDILENNPISKVKQLIPNCVEVETVYEQNHKKDRSQIDLTLEPSKLFSQYLLLKEGSVDEEVIKIFEELYREAVLNEDSGY